MSAPRTPGVTDLHVHIRPWRQLKPSVMETMRRRPRGPLGLPARPDGEPQAAPRDDGPRGHLARRAHQLPQPGPDGVHRRDEQLLGPLRRGHQGSRGRAAGFGHPLPQDPPAPPTLPGQRVHAGPSHPRRAVPALPGAGPAGDDPHRHEHLPGRPVQVRTADGAGRRRHRLPRPYHHHGARWAAAVDGRGVLRPAAPQERAPRALRHTPAQDPRVLSASRGDRGPRPVGHRVAEPGRARPEADPRAVLEPGSAGRRQDEDHDRERVEAVSFTVGGSQ